MKDAVIKRNPEYDRAPYELGFISMDESPMREPYPYRFNSMPPAEVLESKDSNALWKWVKASGIPPTIVVS